MIVHLVNLVFIGNQQGNLTGLERGGAVFLQLGVAIHVVVVHAAVPGFSDAVFQYPNHAPGLVVMGAKVVTGAPDDCGDLQSTLALIEHARGVVGAGAGAQGKPEFQRYGIWVADQPLKPSRTFVEDLLFTGLALEQGFHVLSELF